MLAREWLKPGPCLAAIGEIVSSIGRFSPLRWVSGRGTGNRARQWLVKTSRLPGLSLMRRDPATRLFPVLECFQIPTPRRGQTARTGSRVFGTSPDTNSQTVLALLVLAIMSLLILGTPSLAQTEIAPIPENAHAKSFGDGWECDPSFRVVDDRCAAIVVPDNAYPTNRTYGTGWNCLHGFNESGDAASCIEIVVPAGGYLDQSGRKWRCLRGYNKIKDTCAPIVLPAHAYLLDDTYGPGWACERGYTQTSDQCSAIVVPENAFLNASNRGQPWSCERGFVEADGACMAVIIPANAYFDDAFYGPGWKCERGFSATGNACTAIVLPQNANLDRSGNRWECNQHFRSSNGLCVLQK